MAKGRQPHLQQGYRCAQTTGSTIKPIASYGPALDLGYIMPYTTFNDAANVKLSGTEWYPNNDNGKNEGLVTVRYAIQRSINTIAAQVIDLLKPEVSYYFLKNKVGVSSLVDNEDGFSDIDYAPGPGTAYKWHISQRAH